MTIYPIAFLVAMAATVLAHVLAPRGRMLPAHAPEGAEPLRVGNGLWIGLLAATAVLAALQHKLPVPPKSVMMEGVGPKLWFLLPAMLPLLAATIASDFRRPNSERHALGLAGSGLLLCFAGYSIYIITAPWQGTVGLAPVFVLIFTVMWLFLLASIVELSSLVPLGASLLGLALSMVVWLSGGHQQTVASYALAGIVGGAIVGRGLADLVFRRSVPWGKTEIFALGFWLTAMTNAAFLKGVALAGFVLPLGVIAVAIILVTIRAFERSLLLRPTPRGE